MTLQSKLWLGRLVSRFLYHAQLDTHLVGLLWTSDRPVAEAALPTKLTKETNVRTLSELENVISKFKRPLSYALDCTVIRIGTHSHNIKYLPFYTWWFSSNLKHDLLRSHDKWEINLPPLPAIGNELKKIIFFKYVFGIRLILAQDTEINVWGQSELSGICFLLKKFSRNMRVESADEQMC
jgi:hypothetical protein